MRTASSGFIHSAPFDAVLLLGAPVFSVLLGWACARAGLNTDSAFLQPAGTTVQSLALRSLIHAHLVLVFFRSHGNAMVRARHPVRFWLVPPALLAITYFSPSALIAAIVVAAYWDNYHSSLQTFGLGRIYDRKAGVDVEKGRTLELCLNLLMYLAPFMAGPIWLVMIRMFLATGLAEDHALVRLLVAVQPWIQGALVVITPPFLIVYAVHTWRRVRAGEQVSWQKYALYVVTAVVSVWAWLFNPFGQALLIVNVFHAVQYFAIVWWSERKNLAQILGVVDWPARSVVVALALVCAGGLYGFWFAGASDLWTTSPRLVTLSLAVTNTVALLHFWYDGFIWSVRKQHV